MKDAPTGGATETQKKPLEDNFQFNKPVNALAGDIRRLLQENARYLYSGDYYRALLKAI